MQFFCSFCTNSFLDQETEEQLTVDSDDEFQYEEVPVDEDFVVPGNFTLFD